jgi:membrane protein involved in colicin uptake
MATKETKDPEIQDVDLTHKLLAIASTSGGDASLRATHAAARGQLAKLNQVLQDAVDKQREEARKEQEEADAKAAEEAKLAKRKAEDEAEAAAKKAEDEARAKATA